MKKIISLTCVFLFLGFTAFAQSAEATKTAVSKTKSSCTKMSAEACAAKMGISMEEYRKRGESCKVSTTASAENGVLPVVKVANTSSDAKSTKKCCGSVEECARKMGMTVEECKAKCGAKTALKAEKVEESIAKVAGSQR